MRRTYPLFLLAAILTPAFGQFGPQHFVFQSDVEYPWRIQFADLNDDGHADVLAQESNEFYYWPGDGTGVFGERQLLMSTSLSSGDQLYTVDMDTDGDIDLACKGGWWANDGTGHFTFANNIAGYLILAAIGDVDGDGDADVVGRSGVLNGNILTTTFGVLLNDGSGNFSLGAQWATNAANGVKGTLADFDGDGDTDLVLGGDAALIGYYPNLGSGLFGARQLITGLAGTATAYAGDVEGDGDTDLFVFGGSPAVAWYANDGNAAFAIADTMNGALPAADMDNDGDLDMCVGTGTSCNVRVSRNNGIAPAWSIETVEDFNGYNLVGTRCAWADIDEDGDLDLGVCHGLGMIAWYPNNGDGTFGPRQRIGHVLSGGAGIAVADLDGDGDKDVAAASSYGDFITTYANNGDGTFAEQEVVIEHVDQVSTCKAVDLNGDGFPELLTNKSQAAVLWNDGTGHFTPGILPNNAVATLAGDLDGDFDADLIGGGYWLRNEGGGSFTEVLEPLLAISGSAPAHIADLNGDGLLDVLCTGSSVHALLNNGSGSFTQVTSAVTAGLSDVGDIDQDGDLDFFALQATTVWGYYNDGSGNFTAQQLTAGDVGIPRHIVTVDVSGDGYPDALWARSNGYDHKTFVNLNNGDGTLGATYVIDPVAESTASLVFADVNGDVVPDLIASRFHSITWQENHFFDAFRLRGEVFKDYDQDGIRDLTDAPQAFAPMGTDPTGILSWTNSDGAFDMAVDSGVTYHLWPQLPPIFHVTTEPDTAVVQANMNEPIVDSLLFGLGPVIDSGLQDVTLSQTGLRCNTDGSMFVDVRNIGSTILTDIVVSIALDQDLTLLTAYPTPDSVISNSVYWHVDSMPWFAIEHFRVDIHVGPAGSSSLAPAQVDFASTGTTFNGTFGFETVACSFDPNDKLVLPKGIGVHHAVPIDQDWLDYTIRFQNTGTDTAFNVLLIDRLSADLDWASMEVLGTSHPLTNIFIEEDGELNFRYAHINLPDSGADMAGSNGYVRFRVRPLAELPNLTEIENTAEIYFDYNSPVITNTTLTTLVDCGAFSATIIQLDADLLQASEGDSYQWYQDGMAIPGATAQELVVEVTGVYAVEVTNEYGCTPLSEELQVVISHVGNADMMHMAVVPNPMSDVARVIFSEALPSAAHLELVDVQGRVVRTFNGNGSRELRIERAHLESGIYVLRVMRWEEAIRTVKILVD